jgi:hypothetical protein
MKLTVAFCLAALPAASFSRNRQQTRSLVNQRVFLEDSRAAVRRNNSPTRLTFRR